MQGYVFILISVKQKVTAECLPEQAHKSTSFLTKKSAVRLII